MEQKTPSIKIDLFTLFNPVFHIAYYMIRNQKFLRYVFKGGRNSGKSFHISVWIILHIIVFPVSFLVVRRVANTLETSVYEQLLDAIDILDLNHMFHAKKSPMSITYLGRGNRIIFRGADDASKIKSLKISRFPVAGMWVEETDEFRNDNELDKIEKSVLRAELPPGCKYMFIYSYNPPKKRNHWLNKMYNSAVKRPNTYVHHSTYLDNPHLSLETVREAEIDKINDQRYRWIWLGEAIGGGVQPFENLQFRTITDDEYMLFDNIRQGNDFGYANDPNAFVRWHYDKKHRMIYAMDEFVQLKLSNRRLAEEIKRRNYHHFLTYADSGEPKSIDEIRLEHGVTKFKGAKKGPDSVEYGERWLDDLNYIVIDPKRTPNLQREFENIDYAVNVYGEPLNRLEDKDNHTIDATRYAFVDDMKKKGGVKVWK